MNYDIKVMPIEHKNYSYCKIKCTGLGAVKSKNYLAVNPQLWHDYKKLNGKHIPVEEEAEKNKRNKV